MRILRTNARTADGADAYGFRSKEEKSPMQFSLSSNRIDMRDRSRHGAAEIAGAHCGNELSCHLCPFFVYHFPSRAIGPRAPPGL